MTDMGKALMLVGAVLVLAGALFTLSGKIPWVGRLPGDILVKKENFSFYFPVTTSILVSIILSIMFYFLNRR